MGEGVEEKRVCSIVYVDNLLGVGKGNMLMYKLIRYGGFNETVNCFDQGFFSIGALPLMLRVVLQ